MACHSWPPTSCPFLRLPGPCCYLICSSQFLHHPLITKPRVGSWPFPILPINPGAADIDKRHPRWASDAIKPQRRAAGNGSASWNPKLTSPLSYLFRILAVQCFMLFFRQIMGNLLLISPESWRAERQASVCLSPPWHAICLDETAGPLARGSTPVPPTPRAHAIRLISAAEHLLADCLAARRNPAHPSQASCRAAGARATAGTGDVQVVAFSPWLGAPPLSLGSSRVPAPVPSWAPGVLEPGRFSVHLIL